MKSSNIVHQYFKKEDEASKILIKLNPLNFTCIELTIAKDKAIALQELQFDESIITDLKNDNFIEVNAMEFNLYEAGVL